MEISNIFSYEILDSRGFPTIRTIVEVEDGSLGVASCPSGASTGTHEALELRDNDKKRFLGKGVLKAVSNVNDIIAPQIIGMDCFAQREIDEALIELDGTLNKSNLGANAILSVSMACAVAAANSLDISLYQHIGGINAHTLPVPLMNVINGGKHADSGLNIQEFMIIPTFSSQFKEALRAGIEVYHALKSLLKEKGKSVAIGDEGGFAPKLSSTREALDILVETIKYAGFETGRDIFLGLDAAASEFYKEGKYCIDGNVFTNEELALYYEKLVNEYPIISIEDGFSEDDWEGFKLLNKTLGKKIQLIGDDLYVTNIERLKKGIEENASNSILIKLNQIGTLTETIDTVRLAQRNGFNAIVSHRSGETGDTFIADLAVALDTGEIKTGAPSRSERVEKYNRLLEIEEELQNQGRFGKNVFERFISK